MADEEQVVKLQDNFYRDSFGKVLIIIASLFIAIFSLIGLSLYLHSLIPAPIVFAVGTDWRVQPAVPIDQPYLTTPGLLQWVSDVFPQSFSVDFINYDDQINSIKQYYTENGFKVFQNQLNNYASLSNVQTNKLFVNGVAAGSPLLLDQGLSSGRYAWRIQLPITLYFVSHNRSSSQTIMFQLLVVRVPTLNNLMGVSIDNIVVANTTGATVVTGG